ncbi:hypothetical protein [Acinetobacter baumannii]|uniref:hypothetical protein n=1 Tax=Acinetobacter baumannii TaxID=470 RepID=UPI00148F0A99|nr:hypothetical protein [Acinetobacter baumannii]
MQNDSNVETTQAEIKPFPRQLISDMWDSNVTFNSKQQCIQHLEECIAEKRQEVKEG